MRVALAVTLLALAACRGAETVVSVENVLLPPDFGGVVAAVVPPSGDWLFDLRIARSSGDTAIVWIDAKTRLVAPDSTGTLQTVGRDQLPGATVDVWTTGAEWRSRPPQYQAVEVLVRGAAR